jgi:hypothetical protein
LEVQDQLLDDKQEQLLNQLKQTTLKLWKLLF